MHSIKNTQLVSLSEGCRAGKYWLAALYSLTSLFCLYESCRENIDHRRSANSSVRGVFVVILSEFINLMMTSL